MKHLAIALVASVAAILVLFAASRVLASYTNFNWFLAGCGLLAVLGFVGMIGAAVWNGIILVGRLFGRHGSTHLLLIALMAAFGLVPFAITIVASQPPSMRSTDAAIWAGYGSSRNGITEATASWVQPRVYPLSSRPNVVSFWVGLECPLGHHLEQVGTQAACARHTPAIYRAFYELYPASTVTTNLTIRPGDRVTATAVRLDANHFELTLVDVTTGARFSTVQTAAGVGNTHGDIVTEESALSSDDLAGFGTVHFTRCAFNGKPIDAFRLTSFEIESDAGTLETTTSQIAPDGSSFAVTRR